MRAGLDKNPDAVTAMFDAVATRYDRTNTLLSGGLDGYWRRATRRTLGLSHGDVCLDVAAGTGVSTVELARSGATLIGVDRSPGMLAAGRHRNVRLVHGDALALPFDDMSFDAVTISFGLRNVVDTAAALREMARVTKPGGRLVICEFSHPTWRPFRTVYLSYLTRALPAVARWASSNADAYQYLADTIRAWPSQADLAELIGDNGWRHVRWRDLTGGIVALHRAVRS